MVDAPVEAVETSVALGGQEEASLPTWTCPVGTLRATPYAVVTRSAHILDDHRHMKQRQRPGQTVVPRIEAHTRIQALSCLTITGT